MSQQGQTFGLNAATIVMQFALKIYLRAVDSSFYRNSLWEALKSLTGFLADHIILLLPPPFALWGDFNAHLGGWDGCSYSLPAWP